MTDKTEYIWTCKIGGPARTLPHGADAPMRQAVQDAFAQLTGQDAEFCFSGWGGELTEPERAVVENRLPSAEVVAPPVPTGLKLVPASPTMEVRKHLEGKQGVDFLLAYADWRRPTEATPRSQQPSHDRSR